MWLANVRETTGQEVNVDWQPFSLEQVNSDNKGGEIKFWEQPGAVDGTDNTLLSHRAGLAAKRQGEEAFESFFIALLKLRHEERKSLTEPEVMEEAVAISGIDMARFREDLADPDLLREIGESHTTAVEEYGAFGVPTYIFPNGSTAFVKMHIPPAEQAGDIYESLTRVITDAQHVGEVKRPSPPWPHGII
jgi:predicted DsbA family dithiol-disulfide isomerase